jgi:hypothetical protein
VVRRRDVKAGSGTVSQLGLRFLEGPQEVKDLLARYLHEAAVSRFMKGQALGYRTYLDRRFAVKRLETARAPRTAVHLPAMVRGPAGDLSPGTIENLSSTGLLLASAQERSRGDRLGIEVALADDRVLLAGQVARSLVQPNEDYPEYLVGVQLDGEYSEEVRRLMEVAGATAEFVHGTSRTK